MPRSRQIGAGTVYTLEWEPPLEEIEAALLRTADYADDMFKPLLAARRIAVDDMQEHFVEETDPFGNPWEELDEAYARRKSMEGYGAHILIRTTDLIRAAIDEDAWIILNDTLVFDASGLPEYGLWHQTGKTRARGGSLPERPFIGLSNEAEEKIFTMFDLYVNNANLIWIRPSGQVQQRIPAGSPGAGQFGTFISEFE